MKNALMLGTFDGVHKGHIEVLTVPYGYKKIAVTFIKSPKAVISGKEEAITPFEEKCRILKAAGVDEIYPLDFCKVRDIAAEDFLNILLTELKPSLISCGFNYRFGKDGVGNTELIFRFCKEKGIEFRCASAVEVDGKTVSSTLIRNYLKSGDIETANRLLFEPFGFCAQVKKGAQRGRTIGFPTINQQYPQGIVELKHGVYKVKVITDSGEYIGIADIGIRPTYPTDGVISETYIKDFSGDLYGKNIKIIPLEFLRDEKRFDSIEALKKQIAEDLDKIK